MSLWDQKHAKTHDKEMHSIVYFDASFASDKVTRRSTTSVVVFAGKTPVLWVSKRQSDIATGTYSAELSAGRTRTEKTLLIQYVLRFLGIKVRKLADLLGNN